MKKLMHNKIFIVFLLALIALLSYIVMSYGQFVAQVPSNSRSGVSGTVVTVDDEKADLYYYNSLDYTATGGTLPTGADLNIYNTSNMVKAKITYYGRDFFDSSLVGTVSDTEGYNTYIYYHWYPVENGKVKIPLIDNPFVKRPTGKGFNSWISDSQGVSVYLDKDTYERYAVVTPTSSGSGYSDLDISFYAHWIDAKEGDTSDGWSTVFSRFDTGDLHPISTTHEVCVHPTSLAEVVMNGYYLAAHVNRYNYYTGYYVSGNQIRTANNRYCNTNGGCNYWTIISNGSLYNSNTTYYRVNNAGNNFTVATDAYILENADDVCHDEDSYSSTSVMAGFYTPAGNIARNASIEGYYDSDGYIQSGTCNTNGGCNNLYKYLDKYDSNGNINYFQSGRNYYYLATRDTNIAHLDSSNLTSVWGTSNTYAKPFTFTGMGNSNNNRWSPSGNVTLSEDVTIEHMRINSATQYSYADLTNSKVIIAAYHNLKIGRGLTKYTNNGTQYVNFNGVVGGNAGTGSSSNNTRYKMIVESGYYNNTSVTESTTRGNYTDNLYIQGDLVFGNDLDRVTTNNDNLEVYYEATGSWAGNIRSSEEVSIWQTVKSGKFGTSKHDIYTGIYVGGVLNGTYYSARGAKIEGGWIYNLIGGPLTQTSRRSVNDTYIYMTGGVVDLIIGGAGSASTYGHRIISVTGGLVSYGVLGGSNGNISSASDGSGTVYGQSFIYIGGDAIIGDNTLASTANMYGVTPGNVFGNGNGRENYLKISSNDGAHVVVNDNCTIRGSVYAGGNYAVNGVSSGNSSADSKITILNGTISGNVYGGGNRNKVEDYNVANNVTINMSGGTVSGSIFGGADYSGIITGNTNVNVTGGTVTGGVYGGGEGSSTYVKRNANVTIGTLNTTGPTIGNVYGGSAFGTVNSTSVTTNKSSYSTTVNINAGTITNAYGGGEGDNTQSPCVAGDITVNINGGTTTNAFGGNNANGTPVGAVNVIVNGGTTTNVYGGNNSGGTVTTSNVQMLGGTTTIIYGGGKQASTGTTNVRVNGGTTTTVFGGGQSADVTTRTSVTVDSGTITDAVYGGSNQSGTVTQSGVIINSSVPTVYGGNNAGGTVTTTNVSLVGGTITSAYGGGNNAGVTTSNINLSGSNVTSIYGGGNSAGVSSTNVNLITGTCTNVYGGSNSAGTVDASHVNSNNASNLNVSYIYGGNNAGGKTTNAYINITGGTYTDIYGGGNNAKTDYTTVVVNGITVNDNFFGGGNGAGATVNYSTNVQFNSSNITGDLFGGGNNGEILGNSSVKVSHSNIGGSVYAGGNGQTAIVYGNTNLYVEDASVIDNHVFGGGNAANTGTEETNNSISNVNIAGATIHGNVYGGANTAVLYGTSNVKVGYNQSDYVRTDIQIDGTVFGGGEANASGSPIYDFSFIGVTEGINVYIDGDGYNNLNIDGSIFGSGNASSTSGVSNIYIYNYGTFSNYKENVSIQRANLLTLKNSAIKLEGATDRTNEFSTVKFSLSRIDKLILANDSTLFLDTGTNLLQSFYSEKITGTTHQKASVVIQDDGTTTKSVDNRVYMIEGKNLNIATNENATAYGDVSGMTFFGMYQLDRNGRVMTALYDKAYDNDDVPASGALYAFTSGSYVLGKHHASHNIKVDGFYSNFAHIVEGSQDKIRVKYIEPTPPEGAFYRWVIGEQVTTYEITIAASKYATMGTYELPLVSSANPNTTFNILGFNYQNLEEGFQLVNPNNVPRVNTSGTADTVMGFAMEPSNTGFITSGSTTFMTNQTNPISGVRSYTSENSAAVPTFLFYLYHSKNITRAREIGKVVIALESVTPVDELNNTVERVNINVTLTSALFNNNDYEGSMTSGEKYDLFAPSTTNINTKSTLSAYYSLFMMSDNSYYRSTYNHALVSNFVFPEKTKITMLDLVDNQRYYYVVDNASVTAAESEFQLNEECSYPLSNFIKMGSTSSNNRYDESANASKYYDSEFGIIQEEFIFIVNFEDTDIEGNQLGNTLIMELRNGQNTIISVLGIQRASLTYNLYDNSDAIVDISGNLSRNPVYKGDVVTFNLTGNFTQPVVGTLPVIDTRHFDKKPGVKITILDSNGNQLNNSSLLGLTYTMDGNNYYPRMDGSVRIALTDKVANIFKRIKLDTTNLSMRSGDYTLKFESFTSPDGIYYGSTSQDTLLIPFTFINSSYGLKLKLTDNETIINKITGYTLNDNNILNFKLDYNSTFTDPNIRVALYRRRYDEIYSYDYEQVTLTNYVTNGLVRINGILDEYEFINDPVDGMNKSLYLRSGLVSGTYKFVFSLYDGDVFIGDCMQYVIIK